MCIKKEEVAKDIVLRENKQLHVDEERNKVEQGNTKTQKITQHIHIPH